MRSSRYCFPDIMNGICSAETDLPLHDLPVPKLPDLPDLPVISLPDLPDLPVTSLPELPDLPVTSLPDLPALKYPSTIETAASSTRNVRNVGCCQSASPPATAAIVSATTNRNSKGTNMRRMLGPVFYDVNKTIIPVN